MASLIAEIVKLFLEIFIDEVRKPQVYRKEKYTDADEAERDRVVALIDQRMFQKGHRTSGPEISSHPSLSD